MTENKQIKKGGSRPGAGRPIVPQDQKRVTVRFGIKPCVKDQFVLEVLEIKRMLEG